MNSSDAWFVGATPYLATAVWLGSPTDNQPVVIKGRGITGGNYPAEIWGRYMRAWHEGKPERAFREPAPTRGGRFLQLPPSVDPGGARPDVEHAAPRSPARLHPAARLHRPAAVHRAPRPTGATSGEPAVDPLPAGLPVRRLTPSRDVPG